MEEIIQFLAGILNREFIRAVFSNPRVKDNVVKAKLRICLITGRKNIFWKKGLWFRFFRILEL